MSNVITIGRRLIALEQIAFVEPFDMAAAQGLNSQRVFQARIILINRDSCLIETTVDAFAKQHEFLMLEDDRVAINPRVNYRVEIFEPTEDFTPEKRFATRLLWRDRRGDDHSKLLLSAPMKVLAATIGGELSLATDDDEGESLEPSKQRRTKQAKRPSHEPA